MNNLAYTCTEALDQPVFPICKTDTGVRIVKLAVMKDSDTLTVAGSDVPTAAEFATGVSNGTVSVIEGMTNGHRKLVESAEVEMDSGLTKKFNRVVAITGRVKRFNETVLRALEKFDKFDKLRVWIITNNNYCFGGTVGYLCSTTLDPLQIEKTSRPFVPFEFRYLHTGMDSMGYDADYSSLNNESEGTGWSNEPIISPDGTAYLSVADSALQIKNSVEIEFWYYYGETANWGSVLGLWEVQNNTSNWIKMIIGNNTNNLSVSGKVNNVLLKTPSDGFTMTGFFDTVPGWYLIKLTWNATSIKVYKNGDLVTTQTVEDIGNIVAAGANFRLMNSMASNIPIPEGHKILHFKYTTNGVVYYYPVCEGGGNTVYNVVSNALHLTGQNGFDSLTWALDNDFSPYMGDYGYRLSGSVYIPALLDMSTAADGNPITSPAPNKFKNTL